MSIPRKQFSLEIGGKNLTLEISPLAEKTNAAVVAKYGETVVLVTAVMGRTDSSADYLPLKVDYEERFYAAGKIIGSRFIRREGRPSEEAILTGRLVDRTIRPLFDARLRRDIQVVVTVLSYDEENDPDFVGLAAASTALGISDIPWDGPVGGVRVANVGGKFVINPSNSLLREHACSFESFVAGVNGAINMIELSGREAPEREILDGFSFAQKEIDRLVAFEEKVIREIGKPKAAPTLSEADPKVRAAAEQFLSGRIEAAVYERDRAAHARKMDELKADLEAHIKETFPDDPPHPHALRFLIEQATDDLIHRNILRNEKRPDGRKLSEVRELNGEVKLFERTHGSAVFVRGNTQALAVTTLAAPGAEQLIETMELTGKRRFMLHYNFPPYSVGEIGMFRGPGRREIGHGALAEKSVRSLIPSIEEFPYTIRVVSEILSSNGSSSMATVCATILSLMDAGVPIKKMAAGIAMGLIRGEGDECKVLTDIQGPEDHYGDMDFKVAGTEDGVTAVQMDVKVRGVTHGMVERTLAQAKEARLHILKFMRTLLSAPRTELSRYAPVIVRMKINPERIGEVIGPGGKVINGLIKSTGVLSIDIEEDGQIYIAADAPEKAQRALHEIQSMMREFNVGEEVEGKVIKIMDFGAIVDLGGGRDGMVHVSELKNGYVKSVTEVVKMGDTVKAKVIRVEQGRIGLSMKQR